MSEPTHQELAERRCGARGDNVRAVCELEPDHVKTMDDWHEAHGTVTQTTKTNCFEHTTTQTDVTRWAPSMFELKDEKARNTLLAREGIVKGKDTDNT